MNKKSTLAIAFILILSSLGLQADKRNVLFIGNSYTYVNTLPQILVGLAGSLGDTVTHDSSTPGGATAQQHSANTTTLTKIAQGGWDYVTIQCQSQEPSFPTSQVNSQTLPYVMKLDSTIQATNNCAETLFFMTWGRKVGDIINYPNDTYDAMQQRLRLAYLRFADTTKASVSPVGAAWKMMRDSFPTIDLYTADGSHPSVHGSYLAACVFYCSIFKKSCAQAPYTIGGVSGSEASNMRKIADKIVLDSIENWQGAGGIPNAQFTAIPQLGFPTQAVFTNNSLRFANSNWHFGDGSPASTVTSPSHTFPNAIGTYKVCLEVLSHCGKKDSTCQTLMINPSSTSDLSFTNKIKLNQNAHELNIVNNYGTCSLQIIDINGRSILSQELQLGVDKILTHNLAKGIYILQIRSDNKLLKLRKLFNY